MKSKFLIISLVIGIIICIFFAVHVWAISTIGQKYDDAQNLSNNVQSDLIKNQQLTNLKKSLKNVTEDNIALSAQRLCKPADIHPHRGALRHGTNGHLLRRI